MSEIFHSIKNYFFCFSVRLLRENGRRGGVFLIAEGTVMFVRYISAGFRLKYLRKCVSERI